MTWADAHPHQHEPRPGTGTVFANVDEGDHWVSIWQTEENYVIFEGEREEVLEWALSRPAIAWWVQLFADGRQVQVLPGSADGTPDEDEPQ